MTFLPHLRPWLPIVTLALVVTGLSLAEASPVHQVPEKIPGVTVISPEALHEIMSSKDKKDFLIVDVRKLLEFSEEHLPGAFHSPYKEESKKEINYDITKDTFDIEPLSKHSEPNIVFYCNGHECWKSYKACKWALKHKIQKKIFWFRDGFPGWKEHGYEIEAGR